MKAKLNPSNDEDDIFAFSASPTRTTKAAKSTVIVASKVSKPVPSNTVPTKVPSPSTAKKSIPVKAVKSSSDNTSPISKQKSDTKATSPINKLSLAPKKQTTTTSSTTISTTTTSKLTAHTAKHLSSNVTADLPLLPLPSPCILQAVAESLHPSRVPSKLPCREREQSLLESLLQLCISENKTASVHVCGSPGVGKTAVLSSVFNNIQTWAKDNHHPIPGIHYLNGMSMVLDHNSLYNMLQDRMTNSEKQIRNTSITTSKGGNIKQNGNNSMPSQSAAQQLQEVDKLWQTLQKNNDKKSILNSSSSSSIMQNYATNSNNNNGKSIGSKPSISSTNKYSSSPALLSVSVLGNKTSGSLSSVSTNNTASLPILTAKMLRQQIMSNNSATNISTIIPSTDIVSTSTKKRNREGDDNNDSASENGKEKNESSVAKKGKISSASRISTDTENSITTLKPNGIKQTKGTMMHIVVIDETDALLDRNHEMLYRLFLWPHVSTSRVIIISISNSVDMTQRFLPRLKDIDMAPQVLVFQPYTFEQISTILTERLHRACEPFQQRVDLMLRNGKKSNSTTLKGMPESEAQVVVDPLALTLTSRRVSSKDGDLRKALYLVRRGVLLAIDTYCHEEPTIIDEPEIDDTLQLPEPELSSQTTITKNKNKDNSLLTPCSPVQTSKSFRPSTSTTKTLTPVSTQNAITPPHHGLLSDTTPNNSKLSVRISPRLHNGLPSVSSDSSNHPTDNKMDKITPISLYKHNDGNKRIINTNIMNNTNEDYDSENENISSDEDTKQLDQLKTAILDMKDNNLVTKPTSGLGDTTKNGFSDVPFLRQGSKEDNNKPSTSSSSTTNVRNKLLLLESPILGKHPLSHMSSGKVDKLCSCCRTGFAWRKDSEITDTTITTIPKPASTPLKLKYAVSLMDMTAVLTAAFDRNRYCAALLRLPRDGQLLVCTARGLAEKEANKRAHLEAYERARKEGLHNSYVGTFDGAGLTFSGLATTVGAYRNDGANLTRQLLQNHNTNTSSSSSSNTPSTMNINLLDTPLTLGQLRETFSIVCRKRALSSIDTSEFIDLIDRLESDGILTILNKYQKTGSHINGINNHGRMTHIGFSSIKNNTAWIQSTARLNVSVEDVNFAFGDKTFFTNIIADVKRGVLA